MSNNGEDYENGWREWSNYVLKELERQNDNIAKLTEHVNHRNTLMRDQLIEHDKRLTELELNFALARWITGITVGILIKYMIDWLWSMR